MHDEAGRRCVHDLLQGVNRRVFPVGRLDRDSEGMLLLTDDGALANALTSPKSKVPKTYRVTVDGALTPDAVAQMEAGMTLDDGLELLPAQVYIKSARRTVPCCSSRFARGKTGRYAGCANSSACR